MKPKKNKKITIRVTEDEQRLLEIIRKKQGKTISQLFRDSLLYYFSL